MSACRIAQALRSCLVRQYRQLSARAPRGNAFSTLRAPRVSKYSLCAAGNDFSTLYAPLIRDGRMEKYYWNPSRTDRIGVCKGIFKEDNLTDRDIEELVDQFPGQSIDFFGCAPPAERCSCRCRDVVEVAGHFRCSAPTFPGALFAGHVPAAETAQLRSRRVATAP
jgi:hypothetical protein